MTLEVLALVRDYSRSDTGFGVMGQKMTVASWLPPVVTSGILGMLGWFGGTKLIASTVDKAVQHKLDERLEHVRAEIRSAETALDVLRSSALSGMANRQATVDQRKIEAVEKLWAAAVALSGPKTLSATTGSLKLEAFLDHSKGSTTEAKSVQQFAGLMLDTMIPGGYVFDPGPDRQRPFVSPQAWSLFAAYRTVLSYPIMVLTMAKSGLGSVGMKSPPTELLDTVKSALPHFSQYVDEHGVDGLHLLVPKIEERLLTVLMGDLNGDGADEMTVAQASKISQMAESAYAAMSANKAGPPPILRRGLSTLEGASRVPNR